LAEKLKNTETELETLKESGNAGTASTSIAESATKIEELENKLEELKKENETIETKCKSTEESLSKYKDQTSEILRKSKEKITDTIKEKTEFAEKLKNTETELEVLKESGNAGTASTSGLANEAGMCQFHSENLQKEDCSEVDPRLVTKLLICPFCFCKLASKKDAENHVFIHHKVDAATFQNLNLNFDSMEV
jgi:chromosome segregation ATPase